MKAYLAGVESGYVSTNPYHNSIHAADVLHACYYFMKQAFKKGGKIIIDKLKKKKIKLIKI
jgi:hypothetical protein